MEFSIRNLFNKDKNGSQLNAASAENGSGIQSKDTRLSSLDLSQAPQNSTPTPHSDPQALPQQPPPLVAASPSNPDPSPFAAAQAPPQAESTTSPFTAAQAPPQPESTTSPFTAAQAPPQPESTTSPFAAAHAPPQPESTTSPFAAAHAPPQPESTTSPFTAAHFDTPFAPAESTPTPVADSPFSIASDESNSQLSPLPSAETEIAPSDYNTPPVSPFTAAAGTLAPTQLPPFAAAAPGEKPPAPTTASSTVEDSPFASASPFSADPSSLQPPPLGIPPYEPANATAASFTPTPPANPTALTPSPFAPPATVTESQPSNPSPSSPTADGNIPPFAPTSDETSSIELPLQEILSSYSIEQLGFDPSKVPAHVTTKLPLAIIKPQLSSGNISLALTTIVEGCDERFHRAFAQADPNLEIRVPIQQVFRYLPAGCMVPSQPAPPLQNPIIEPQAAPFQASADSTPLAPAEEFETPFSTRANEDAEAGLSAPPVDSSTPPTTPVETSTLPSLFPAPEAIPETTQVPLSQSPAPEPSAAPILPEPESQTESPFANSPFGPPITTTAGTAVASELPPPPFTPPSDTTEKTQETLPPTFQELDLSTQDPAGAAQSVTPEPFIPDPDPAPQANSEAPKESNWATAIPPLQPINPTSIPRAESTLDEPANPWGNIAEQTPEPAAPPSEPIPQPTVSAASGNNEIIEDLAATAAKTEEAAGPQPTGFTSLKPLTPLPTANADFGLGVPTGGIGGASTSADELTSDDILEDLEDLPAYGTTPAESHLGHEIEEDFTFGFQDDDPTLLTLRAVFETDEKINIEKAVELSGLLPGIAAAIFLDGHQAVSSRDKDDLSEPFATKAPEVYQSVRGLATAMGMGDDASTFTIRTNTGIMSFFKEGEACLGVLHQNNGFLPGIREKLTLVTRGLAGMALPS